MSHGGKGKKEREHGDRSGNETSVQTSDTLVGEESSKGTNGVAKHATLLVADDQSASNFERMGEKDSAESEANVGGQILVSEGSWQESSHDEGVSGKSSSVAKSAKARQL